MAGVDDDLTQCGEQKIVAKRYLDDVLLFLAKGGWDHERFYKDFKRSECYARPLNLEETADETFLETTFRVEADRIRFRLKNVNVGDTKKVWRYQSFDSYSPREQKWRTLVATLKVIPNTKGWLRATYPPRLPGASPRPWATWG